MAQQDVLKDFNEHGVYAGYLIGELYVDALDEDDKNDSATSNRQGIKEDDARYIALKKRLKNELKHIQGQWTQHRIIAGGKKAQEIPAIKTWLKSKKGDNQKKAHQWIGKINKLEASEHIRKDLYKYSVLTFEKFEAQKNLSKLEDIHDSNLKTVLEIFGNLDDLENSMYGEAVKIRLGVLRKIEKQIHQNNYENIIRDYIFNHLWLLDPHWDHATKTKESTIEKAFGEACKQLTNDEKSGRLDITYQKIAGKHVIVELKRPKVSVDTQDAIRQLNKYKFAALKVLAQQNEQGGQTPKIECILIVGCDLKDWKNSEEAKQDSINQFRSIDMRVIFYNELIRNAKNRYEHYLESEENINDIRNVLDAIDKFNKAD